MTAMKAGRELDALVAEMVVNLPKELISINGPIAYQGHQVREIELYSTDICAAWEVVEKMVEKVCDMSLERAGLNWHATFAAVTATASTPEMAICLAALKFIGLDVTELHESSER
jgi:hypothetical protein